jgi:hypothetical protein
LQEQNHKAHKIRGFQSSNYLNKTDPPVPAPRDAQAQVLNLIWRSFFRAILLAPISDFTPSIRFKRSDKKHPARHLKQKFLNQQMIEHLKSATMKGNEEHTAKSPEESLIFAS